MADIVYEYMGGLYLNITNDCPCRCVFCIRDQMETLGSASEMWHENNPDFESIKNALDSFDTSKYSEAVFCGYGEPTCAFENLVKTAKYIKEKYSFKIRVNTNGLGNLINKRDITPELCEIADVISISLNAPNAERYLQITRNDFGIESFDAMLDFTKKCVEKNANVRMTVVDVIKPEEIEECAKIAESIGAKFVSRVFTTE
ncbi:MAG: TIGR04100 family radical SAM protein [Clostridia bacterium]|nr:TIGR04100 family radical SAM protein [Clostridia bacterium]